MEDAAGMDADPLARSGFAAEIHALIREVENCLGAAGDDREARLQREVFYERRERATGLAHRLGSREPASLDGDAQRLREALRLSREFFHRRART